MINQPSSADTDTQNELPGDFGKKVDFILTELRGLPEERGTITDGLTCKLKGGWLWIKRRSDSTSVRINPSAPEQQLEVFRWDPDAADGGDHVRVENEVEEAAYFVGEAFRLGVHQQI